MIKNIVVCADDYGQNAAISQAIINLIQKNRLTATSCMATIAGWPEHATALAPFKDTIDIGLHFNLTESTPSSLPTLILQAYTGELEVASITDECLLQLDTFTDALGMVPDFIDGHQHVHQLPVIRKAILAAYQKRFPDKRVYIRSVYQKNTWMDIHSPAYLKRCIINCLGAATFKKLLQSESIPHNTSFSGIYDFKEANQYASIFKQFLAHTKEGGLIMCHPGMHSVSSNDVISQARFHEYEYFCSEQYLEDCTSQNISISRFKTVPEAKIVC